MSPLRAWSITALTSARDPMIDVVRPLAGPPTATPTVVSAPKRSSGKWMPSGTEQRSRPMFTAATTSSPTPARSPSTRWRTDGSRPARASPRRRSTATSRYFVRLCFPSSGIGRLLHFVCPKSRLGLLPSIARHSPSAARFASCSLCWSWHGGTAPFARTRPWTSSHHHRWRSGPGGPVWR